MKEFEKIVQYHVDNNLYTVSTKYRAKLSNKELIKLRHILKLNKSLDSLRVKDSFGKESLKLVLSNPELSENPRGIQAKMHSLKFAVSGFAVLLILVIGGGIGFVKINNENTASKSNISKISANGSVDNLNDLNIADAQNDISLASETKSDQSINAQFSNQSNVDEAIYENF